MAALVPLLMPHIIDATVKLGLGISNAIQGDSSSISLQIGNKVFMSKKKFTFQSLPPELRRTIILMAMDASVDLILPPPFLFDPTQAFSIDNISKMQLQHPLIPNSQRTYRSVVGDDVSANGFPISTWRWTTVNSEWRDVVRPVLWKDLEVVGYRPWARLLDWIEHERHLNLLAYAQSLLLREGFAKSTEVYTILSNPKFENLETISILPDYPTTFHPHYPSAAPFTFGLQMIRAPKPLKSLTFGMPLEVCTNNASRQHLKDLHPSKLELTVTRPYMSLFDELKDLVGDTTDHLSLRYTPTRSLTNIDVFLCKGLQGFKKVTLYLQYPRVWNGLILPFNEGGSEPMNQETYTTSLISALERETEEVQERYTIYRVENWERHGAVVNAKKTKIWPPTVLFDMDQDEAKENTSVLKITDGSAKDLGGSSQPGPSTPRNTQAVERRGSEQRRNSEHHWERQTKLSLFGGLVNLNIESKRHGA